MRKTFSLLTLAFAFLLASPKAHALFELRGTYGTFSPGPDTLGVSEQLYQAPKWDTTAMGADLLFFIPLTGFGAGVRYEELGTKVTGNLDYSANVRRNSLLLTYRLIDTVIHFGPILSYGVSHTGSVDVRGADQTVLAWRTSSATSYSAGLDLGIHLIGFTLGIESGYQEIVLKSLSDANSHDPNSQNLGMRGAYSKAYFGLSI